IEAMQTLRQGASVGVTNPWHASSLGKSILAWLDTHEVSRLLKASGFPRYTHNTLVTLDQLRGEFPLIRERGYAVDNEESAIGGRCIGAPVYDETGRPLGAIS
ncbi:MAG: IclR family transcriptional regulator, partial [Mesorhizobium sp.]